ncbi:alginate lyase [Asticcacaulis biprosthecium C19]|uniref:Alginate lyase n=1 Tax=Asticcacaulis biprosthecium C19 TaxID=715226 RepID=F4QTL1_9CAUL|nr:alginate lyase family protein [Asticcacaulis biprosthecium]EGF90081.1 alginate lyase [Asticcacaulis biprosthecium C19]
MFISRRDVLAASAGACLLTLPAQAATRRLRPPFAVPRASGVAPKAKHLPKTEPVRELANESRYRKDDPSRSTVDPELSEAYERSVAPLRAFSQSVIRAANRYVASDGKNLKAAAEAGGILATWAGADSLKVVSGETAQFSRLLTLGAASLGLMQIEGALKPTLRTIIANWLEDRAGETYRHYAALKTKSAANNHRYWAGLSVLSAGIVANRRDLFDWGVSSARIGIAEVTAEGALPLELARGQRALSYHAYALAPLVLIAEAAARNGDSSLYDENSGALHRLIDFCLTQLDDPTRITQLAGTAQEALPNGEFYDSGDVAWLEIYESRFPGRSAWSARLPKMRPMRSTNLGGDITLLFARPGTAPANIPRGRARP